MSGPGMRIPSRRLSDERRVIFPSLHGEHAVQTRPVIKTSSPNTQLIRTHTPPPMSDNIIVQLEKSPKSFAASHISPNGPIERSKIERSNSLDDLLNSLPPLSLNNNNINVKPRNVHARAPQATRYIFSPTSNIRGLVSPQSSNLKSFTFPERKTFYPVAAVPASREGPGTKLLSETDRKPPPSILRKSGRYSYSTASGLASPAADKDGITTTPQQTPSSLATQNQLHLSPNMPTLASPTSIKTLSPSMKRHDSNDTLGESEVLDRLSTVPKLLPKPKTIMKRNQSDHTVYKNEEDERQRLRKLSEGSENDHVHRNRSSSGDVCVSRHASFERVDNGKKPKIGFDPHVWIHEYNPQLSVDERWFTDDELTEFKRAAVQRVRLKQRHLLATGTGRVIEVPSARSIVGQHIDQNEPVRFNHPALGCDDEVDTDDTEEKLIQDALSREIRSVLLVDVHEIFLALFTKSLRSLFPHISVTTARSGEEAIARIDAAQKAFPLRDGGSLHGFDIILVEERLGSLPTQLRSSCSDRQFTQAAGDDSIQRRRMTSGSELIRSIAQEERNFVASGGERRCALLIGVSARFTEDEDVLKKSGADILWPKPPPEMNRCQRNHLLKVLMKKRGRNDLLMFE